MKRLDHGRNRSVCLPGSISSLSNLEETCLAQLHKSWNDFRTCHLKGEIPNADECESLGRISLLNAPGQVHVNFINSYKLAKDT